MINQIKNKKVNSNKINRTNKFKQMDIIFKK